MLKVLGWWVEALRHMPMVSVVFTLVAHLNVPPTGGDTWEGTYLCNGRRYPLA